MPAVETPASLRERFSAEAVQLVRIGSLAGLGQEVLGRPPVQLVGVQVFDLRLRIHLERRMTRGSQQRQRCRVSGRASVVQRQQRSIDRDRKSTRLNSSHLGISYAV